MKKTLIALAAVAATGAAFAQSTVTLSGNIDAGYAALNYKGGKSGGITNNGSSTSTIQLSGSEDLGGGLKANFKLNSDFNPTTTRGNTGSGATTAADNTAGSWLNSEQRVGLSGGFGAIDFGVINNGSLTAAGRGTPFGTAIGSGFRSIYTTDALTAAASSPVRHDNSARYTSPTFSGFGLQYYFVKKNTKATATTFGTTFGAYDTTGISEITATYGAGPLSAAVAFMQQDAVGTNATLAAKGKLTTAGANYAFGPVTAYAMYQKAKADSVNADGALDRTTTFLGVKFVEGPHAVMAQVGTAKLDASNLPAANAQVEGQKSKVLGLGYDYSLSKRTTAYVRAERITDKAGMVAPRATIDVAGNNKISRTAVGVRHTF
jgi:predicted porin